MDLQEHQRQVLAVIEALKLLLNSNDADECAQLISHGQSANETATTAFEIYDAVGLMRELAKLADDVSCSLDEIAVKKELAIEAKKSILNVLLKIGFVIDK